MDGRGEESLVWRIFLIDKLRLVLSAGGSTGVEPSYSYN